MLEIVHERGCSDPVDDTVIEGQRELGSLLESEARSVRDRCFKDFSQRQGCNGWATIAGIPKRMLAVPMLEMLIVIDGSA